MRVIYYFLIMALSSACNELPVKNLKEASYKIVAPQRYKDEIKSIVDTSENLKLRMKEIKIFSHGVFFSARISADYGAPGSVFSFLINDRNLDILVSRAKKALVAVDSLFAESPDAESLCDLPEVASGMENFAHYFIEEYLPKLKSLRGECLINTLQPVYDQFLEELLSYLVSRKDLDSCYVLTRVAKHDELENLQTIIFALSEIGGKESVSYLHAIAYGHPVGQIRVIAAEALSEIKSKKN